MGRSWPEPGKSRSRLLEKLNRRLDRVQHAAQQPCRRDVPPFDRWLSLASPEFRWDWPHLVYLRERLEALASGTIERLAIFMPPRHMKTSQSTIRFPLWRLEQDPKLRIILGAYNQTYAEKMNREMRKIAKKRLQLSPDRKSAKAWETLQGGGVRACGVGSPPTGEGADLLIIDDPIKSRQDADSPTIRERAWDWYAQDLFSRVEPGGRVLLIQCMTGDTPVMMADGSEKFLRDVRPGDSVVTYEEGCVSVSTVRNWANNGPDRVYEIRMQSGAVVKANARHPFLMEEKGKTIWKRTAAIQKGNIILKVIKANGKASNVSPKDVNCPLRHYLQPLTTCKVIRDSVVEIVDAGIEDVFDVEIDRTSNFIANGLVSHNTRWHPDDLAGRILAGEEAHLWSVVRLPALAEENDPLGRAVGEALCPERYSVEALKAMRRTMGDHAFEALYQQNPTPKSGGMFKEAWFQSFVSVLPANCTLVRYWDKAGTAGAGCYTAGVLMARDKQGAYYLVDVRRKQLDAAEREAWILATAHEDRAQFGRVETGVEREGGSGGKESAQATLRMLAGFPCYEDAPTGSKEARAEPLASQFGAGNVHILAPGGVAPEWYRMFREEALQFPRGTYLDMIDAASGAFARLSNRAAKGKILV